MITTSNDLNSDQRMRRISNWYYSSGEKVLLIGHQNENSVELITESYAQRRIKTFFKKGPLFYAEFNFRLFKELLFLSSDRFYAVDLDTILAVRLASGLRRKPFNFDAHEDYTEVPELEDKKLKKWIWNIIGRSCVPQAEKCISVGEELAHSLSKKYNQTFKPIYNYPLQKPLLKTKKHNSKFTIIYQGKLNKGRGIMQMIEVMDHLPQAELWVIGDGDLQDEITTKVQSKNYANRIKLMGWKPYDDIHGLTCQSDLGINILDPTSKSYYHSAANKFFDYIMAGVPVLTMNFPEYRKVNEEFDVAYLIDSLSIENIVNTIQNIISQKQLYKVKKKNCLRAKKYLCWENEREKLPG